MTDRRGYVAYVEHLAQQIEQGKPVKFHKLIEDSSIDPVTTTMLERVGMLGGDLPTRIAIFMQVLTGIRIDLVRLGRGDFDNDLPAALGVLREDLKLWTEFEPKARVAILTSRGGECTMRAYNTAAGIALGSLAIWAALVPLVA